VKVAALIVFAAAWLALALAQPARSATGMSSMQYYVGTWSCTGGPIGKKPLHATIKYTLDGNILQNWIHVSDGYVSSGSLVYDSKKDGYVSTGAANDGSWSVSHGTLNGNTETFVDDANSTGKLGRGVTVRNSSSSFTYTGYPTASGGTANFKAACQKS
jgi:hypothetical protein